jgi:hypothetical protein
MLTSCGLFRDRRLDRPDLRPKTKAAADAGILTTVFDWSMLRRAIKPLRQTVEPIRSDCDGRALAAGLVDLP